MRTLQQRRPSSSTTTEYPASVATSSRLHRTIWRWHFYAGLFCLPFVLWLATTGSIYLFKPQFEAWQDRAFDHLSVDGPRASAAAQVQAALAAVPGTRLNAYELPASDTAAARVLVGSGREITRVYVHPQTLAVLKTVREDDRLMRVISRLHGELMAGDIGSYLVELAASWAIVMILSGLYLWWPRKTRGLAGVVYPRLRAGGRTFWRDLHAVTGLWVSLFALFLLVSGLPWAKSWGGMLKTLRQLDTVPVAQQPGQRPPAQDWTTGRTSELAQRAAENAPAPIPTTDGMAGMEHAGHHRHAQGDARANIDLSAIDSMVATVAPLALAPPVLIAPPSKASTQWTARSDAANRPLRVTLTLDATSGAVLKRQDFGSRPLLDRIIGTGVAAHEGQLFGWFNQLLGVLTALGLTAMSLGALVLWWQRKPAGALGAPKPLPGRGFGFFIAGLVVALGILLPLLGVSMIAVLLAERFVLRRITVTRNFLGLRAIPS
jgi:uncharacterized iron-regulated membrane protein